MNLRDYIQVRMDGILKGMDVSDSHQRNYALGQVAILEDLERELDSGNIEVTA